MANRFRAAIKGTSQEILSAGKVDVPLQEPIVSEPKMDVHKTEEKEVQRVEHADSFVSNAVEYPVYGDISFEKVSEFLKQKVNHKIFELRMSKIKDILNALIDYKRSHKPIMLCDFTDNIPYWVAAIKMSLPKKVASTLVFRNYKNENSPDITNCLVFIDSTEERLNPNYYSEDDPNVVAFNFAKGSNTRVAYNSRYSELAQVGYMLNDQSFYVFENFVDEFNYTKLGPDIDSCLELFYLLNNGIEYMEYDSINKAMTFIDNYAYKDTYKMLLQKMNVVVSRVGANLEEKTALILIKTMMDMSSKLGEEVLYNMVCKFFYGYLQSLLSKTGESNIEAVYKFFNNIKNIQSNDIKQFAKYTIDEENIRRLSRYVLENDVKYAQFYLGIVLSVIQESNIDVADVSSFEEFISNCAEQLIKNSVSLKSAIGGFNGKLTYVASLIGLYYSKAENNPDMRQQAVLFCMEKLKENTEKAKELRNLIYNTPKGTELILEEFAINLKEAHDKDQFFWTYLVQVLDGIAGFRQNHFSEAIAYYLDLIKDEPIFKEECLKIIIMASKNQIEIDNKALTKIIEEYENQIPLKVQDKATKDAMITLSAIKRRRNIVTANNIVDLTEFGIKLENAGTYKAVIELLTNGVPDLTNVSDAKYKEFLQWTIDLLLTNSHSRITDILGYYKSVCQMKEQGSEMYVEYALSTDRVIQLKEYLSKMNTKQVQFYMSIILEHLINNRSRWDNQGLYEGFINNCVDYLSEHSKELYTVMELITPAKEFFAHVLVRYYMNLKNNSSEAVKFFMNKSKANGEEWTDEVRLYIGEAENGLELLLDEFKILFDKVEEKTEFFWSYSRMVFNRIPKFKNEYFSNAFEYYMNTIEGTDRYIEECMNILELVADEKVKLNPNLLSSIVKEYEATIPLTFPAQQTLAIIDEIEAIKRKNNIDVKPSVGDVLRLGILIQSTDLEHGLIGALHDTDVRLDGSTPERYTEYLNWCLPNLFSKLNVLENAALVKKVFYVEEYKETFSKIYNDLLMQQIRSGVLNASKFELLGLLKEMNLETSELSTIMVSYYGRQKEQGDVRDSVGLFVDIIDSKSIEQANDIRASLSTLPNGNELLFEEYISNLNVASNVQKFFWRYVKNVFNEIPSYKEEYFVLAISKYLDCIEGTQDYSKACYELLGIVKESEEDLGSDLETRILIGCEMMLSLSKSYDSQFELINELERVKTSRRIKTSPDMVALVKFATEFEKVKGSDQMHKLLNKANLDLDDMDIIKYEEFLDYFLPRIALAVNSWTIHAVIKKVFCVERRKALFFTKYVSILADNIEMDKILGTKIFAEFIVYFFNSREQHGEDLYVQVKTSLISILYRLNANILKDINNSLKAEISGMRNKEMIIKDWDQMYLKVAPAAKTDTGFFGRFFDRR